MDRLLIPFLTTVDEEESARLLGHLVSEQATPIIKRIIKSKLRNFFTAKYYQSEANDAEDLYADVVLQLLMRLTELKKHAGSNAIEDIRSYVAVLTYNACHEYLRKKYPQRHSLKNQLRYLLTHQTGFALWESKEKVAVCGFAAWQREKNHLDIVSSQDLSAALAANESALNSSISGRRDNLADLVALIFNKAGSPLRLQDLINVVADLLGVGTSDQAFAGRSTEEHSDDYLDRIADPHINIDSEMEQRAYLQLVWTEICNLPLRQRAALLLNLRDPYGSDIMSLFTIAGVASLRQIAEALEIPAEQFAAMWNELPLNDVAIASQLGITRQQVINLRKSARERLARRLLNSTKGKGK
jgi:DNA-directed RNA polymerase specialized sigma24 family protein